MKIGKIIAIFVIILHGEGLLAADFWWPAFNRMCLIFLVYLKEATYPKQETLEGGAGGRALLAEFFTQEGCGAGSQMLSA